MVYKRIILSVFLGLFLMSVKAQKNVVISEGFQDNSRSWMVGSINGSVCNVQNGKYYFQRKTEAASNISWRRDISLVKSNPYEIECTAQFLEGDKQGFAGLMWGGKKTLKSSYTALVINAQKQVGIIQILDNESTWLLDPHIQVSIKPSSANKLKVVHEGNQLFQFYLNGVWLDSLRIDNTAGDWLGFYVGAKQRVTFDDFKVMQEGVAPVVASKGREDVDMGTTKFKSNFVMLDADVDFPPATFTTKPEGIAVVIGNRNYDKTKKVDYAINDAKSMKNFLATTMGFQEGNIFYVTDASLGDFNTFFGTKDNPRGKLFNNLKPGISEVFVFYSGHGAPGLRDNKGYFVPVECDPNYVENSGYSLDIFMDNLSKLPAKNVTVMMDACFSGDVYSKISPIVIKSSAPTAKIGRSVVLSSSSASQVSAWYPEKKHGLFTYMVLKAAIDKEHSDKDRNGKLSYKELYDYVSDESIGVPYFARKLSGIEQVPTIIGDRMNEDFVVYKKK